MLSGWPVQIVLTTAHVVGLLLFLRGFFPSKVVLPGNNSFTETPSPFASNGVPQFDKFILMVVDAMRSDFCYSDKYSDMKFLHSLINDGSAIPFTAFSNPPTVTLPRLKGITTGGAPSFLDAILNVADDNDSSQGLAAQDSWVSQFLSQNKKINFFGDDTWLKLFPDSFSEFEGTNSFFVSDFTEVDNNVTKHLDDQLVHKSGSSKWDGLILHYLGLDHIGHKGGPDSIFMKPKQREMDAILHRLYTHVDDRTLIVMMGDHGMNEGGNHGGSSPGETSAALTFISKKKFKAIDKSSPAPLPWNEQYSFYNKVNQVDLVPTIATLLNFPIPKNNLGIVIPSFLQLWPKHQHARILRENCKQFMSLFTAKYGDKNAKYSDIYEQWEIINKKIDESDTNPTESVHYDFLYEIQDVLASSATNYNYDDIKYGYSLIVVSAIVSLGIFTHYFIQQSKSLTIGFLLFALSYAGHFHGSSLIEEEHQIWWFISLTSAVLFVFHFKIVNYYTLALFFGLRAVKAWGNSGQKYVSPYTIAAYLMNQNQDLLWVLVMLTYVFVGLSAFFQGGVSKTNIQGANLFAFISIFIACSMSVSFKLCQSFNDGHDVPSWTLWFLKWILESFNVSLDFTSNAISNELKFQLQSVNIQLSQFTGIFVAGLIVVRVVSGKFVKLRGSITDFTNLFTIYLLHQTRLENIPIFLVFAGIKFAFSSSLTQLNLQNRIDNLLLVLGVFTLCLQNLSFFSVGNTNSLATVDLSNAYNGIKSYDVGLVGLQTFVSNFSVVIYWSISSLQMIFESEEITKKRHNSLNLSTLKRQILLVKSRISLLFYSLSAISLVGSCIHLRFHLFIWTVFSPKLLYFGAWSVFVSILVDLIMALIVLFVLN